MDSKATGTNMDDMDKDLNDAKAMTDQEREKMQMNMSDADKDMKGKKTST